MPDDDVIGFAADTDPNDDDRVYMGVDIASTPVDRHVLKVDFLGRKSFKDSVRLATEVNDSLSGLAARDGITPIANDRVLVKAQTAGQNNGIYLAQSGAWTRAKDFNTSPKATSGAFAVVQEGTVNADKLFQLTTNEPITLDTTVLVFTEFGSGNVSTTTPNTYDTGQKQTFHSSQFVIRNPADTFEHIFVMPASGLNRTITFPDATGTVVVTGLANQITDTELTAGSFPKITGVGTLTVGVWNATDIVFANIQQIATNRLLGRNTAATGDIEELTHDATLEFNVLEFRRAAITGDITIAVGSNAAVFGVGVIVDADINASAAIAFSKLATLTSGNLLVGSAGNVVTSVNPSGDIDISATGVFSISTGVILNADINASAAIVMSKITGTAAQFNTALSDNTFFFTSNNISNMATSTSAQFDTANSDGNFFLNADNISAMAASTVAQFNTALTGETFAFIGVANAWGTINQNIAATGKWQEGGVNISPIGIHDIPVGATAMYVTTNTPATGLTLTNFATGDIDLQTFDFTSTAADETVQFRTPFPRNYNNGAITVTINWSQASGTGNVVWRIGAVARGQSEAIGLAFTYSADLVDAAGTANQIQSTTTASFTPAGTPVDDDELHFEVQRQGSDALDTFTGTARLHSIVIHITTDAATAA